MNPPSEVIRRSSSAGDAVGAGVEGGPAVGAGVAPPAGEGGEGAAVVPQAAARMATTAPRTAIRDWGTERITWISELRGGCCAKTTTVAIGFPPSRPRIRP